MLFENTEKPKTSPFFEHAFPTATIQPTPTTVHLSNQQQFLPRHYYKRQHHQQSISTNNRTYSTQNNHLTSQHNRKDYPGNKTQQLNPCLICNKNNHTTTKCFYKKNNGCFKCGQSIHQIPKESSTSTTFTPIFVKILCNNTAQKALIDTGSAITIIHQHLLNDIQHEKLIPKTINHLSANCSTLNIIGEIPLEINVNGIKTTIIANVTTNLVTNLILDSDWIQSNNVYILTPEQRIMIRRRGKEVSIPFVKPPLLNYPASLINYITLPPFSEKIVEAKVQPNNITDVLFEPNPRLKNKALFTANALLNIENRTIKISIINAMNRQQTLSEGTKLERIPKGKAKPSKIDIIFKNAIGTGTHRPIHTSPYRKSNKDPEILRKETEKLLKNGIIEQSTSPWSSPVVLVKKKDGTTRFCVDYRRLNQITTKDAFPLPRIDAIYDQLTKATYFTKFDFKAGYFQVPLDKADRPKTAFSTRDGHFQFKVLPQGLTNGPPTFQRIVNQILGRNRWKHVLAYIDDIIIYSQNFNEHLKHIEEVVARREILFLGHVIKAGTIKPDPNNIRGLADTEEPTSAEEAFRFVKAAEYYRKFIPKFSTIAAPLHKYSPATSQQTINKKTKFALSAEAREAFHQLKKILTTDLILDGQEK
ncbi:unnamed protein product [Rotaria sp. Silwood2]|nr:unnamed protein product [Rotaria sp. Silwood2]CAF2846722.1 unnamed protein product [Rotaria sp. Silwood2]CAF3072185.1 unnamed protein product [Rotaria sp. Silwood2]CAF4403830.1 unnamed protein product [Rotaria sp. Silwood2]CAF4410367.1 unnamed protein product [Rotaria sp. Silwood2]